MSTKGMHLVRRPAVRSSRSDSMSPKELLPLRFAGAWRAAVMFATTCVLAAGAAAPAAAENVRNAGGFELHLGVLPAEMMRGYSSNGPERAMHNGMPSGRNQRHVVIAVFDARTGTRIEDAVVTAIITEPGLAPVQKTLQPMPIAGAMSYGNYFPMSPPGPYRIDVHVQEPATGRDATTSFTYSVPR